MRSIPVDSLRFARLVRDCCFFRGGWLFWLDDFRPLRITEIDGSSASLPEVIRHGLGHFSNGLNLLIQQAGIATKLDLAKMACLEYDLPFRFQQNGVQIGTNCVPLLDQIRNERASGAGPAVHRLTSQVCPDESLPSDQSSWPGIDHPLFSIGSAA